MGVKSWSSELIGDGLSSITEIVYYISSALSSFVNKRLLPLSWIIGFDDILPIYFIMTHLYFVADAIGGAADREMWLGGAGPIGSWGSGARIGVGGWCRSWAPPRLCPTALQLLDP